MRVVMATGLSQLLLMCLLLRGAAAQRNKEELIQDTVRKFLGVKADERTAVPGKVQSLPPRYMMDLYEKYRSGQTPMQGNTVRSILAMQVKVDKVDMLVFNLTGLKSTEQILQSKLYLLKRRKPKGGKKRDQATFRLSIGCLPDMASRHEIDISLARHKPEWHSYDISESVVSCRQTRKGNDSLLGLKLDVRRAKGSYRPAAFKRLVKPNSQPFVLIFSEDSHTHSQNPWNATQDAFAEIGDLLRAKANEEGFLPQNVRPSHAPLPLREKRSSDPVINKNVKPDFLPESDTYGQKYLNAVIGSFDFEKNSQSDFLRSFPSVIENIRYYLSVVRNIYDVRKPDPILENEMHQRTDFSNDAELGESQLSNLTNKEVIKKVLFSKTRQNLTDRNRKTKNNIKFPSSTKRYKRTLSDTLRYSTEIKESNLSDTIQVFDENHPKKQSSEVFPKPRRRKVHQTPRKHKKKRRRNRKLPVWWTRHDSRLRAQDLKQLCKRKNLMVDFSQLGWDDWIISPKSFNAHFCEGTCTFPVIKHTEASNHAAVQSLIQALGLHSDVPTPSCVPATTSSLTLLYFDENGGLVLKSYPHMIVEKCGCR